MKKLIKKMTSILGICICLILYTSNLAEAGTLNVEHTLPADGTHIRTGLYVKTTTVQGSYITPQYWGGVRDALYCRTLCVSGDALLIYSNPNTLAPKDSTTWMGVYSNIELYAGQRVCLEAWTAQIGTQDILHGVWDFK